MSLPGGHSKPKSSTERRKPQGGGEHERGLNPPFIRVARGESMRGGLNPPFIWGVRGASPGIFFKIYVSENAFQAILKPIFPHLITSILSKVRHSNTLFSAINFSFPF